MKVRGAEQLLAALQIGAHEMGKSLRGLGRRFRHWIMSRPVGTTFPDGSWLAVTPASPRRVPVTALETPLPQAGFLFVAPNLT